MQLIVFFDLPVQTKKQRKAAREFRKHLLCDGYQMMQKSVYQRYCNTKNAQVKHVGRLKKALPVEGSVYVLPLTDSQYGSIKHFQDRILVMQPFQNYTAVEEY